MFRIELEMVIDSDLIKRCVKKKEEEKLRDAGAMEKQQWIILSGLFSEKKEIPEAGGSLLWDFIC